MLSWIMLLLVLFSLTVIGTWVWGSIFGRGEVMHPLDEPDEWGDLASFRRAVAGS